MNRTCKHQVPTGETRRSPCTGEIITVRKNCCKAAVEHVIVYSESDWDDDDQHIFLCVEHAGTFTPSDNVKVFPHLEAGDPV